MDPNRRSPHLLLLLAVLAAIFGALVLAGQEGPSPTAQPTVRPSYDAAGNLLLPTDWRQWVLAGTALDLSYNEEAGDADHHMFHHVLIEPTAYQHFAATGEFREGTMFVLTLHGATEGVLPQRHGSFAGEMHGLEMAVKDSSRVPEGWAYYGFGGMAGLTDRAQPDPKERCYACHVAHAAKDNVFLQFYPQLADVAPAPNAPSP